MKLLAAILVAGLPIVILAFADGCSVLGQKNAQKPSGTDYSAAFIRDDTLIVFPFDGSEIRTNT